MRKGLVAAGLVGLCIFYLWGVLHPGGILNPHEWAKERYEREWAEDQGKRLKEWEECKKLEREDEARGVLRFCIEPEGVSTYDWLLFRFRDEECRADLCLRHGEVKVECERKKLGSGEPTVEWAPVEEK